MKPSLFLRLARALRAPQWRRWLALLAFAPIVTTGCSRAHYRKTADSEVYCLIENKAQDPHWTLDDYTIDVDPRSRMFDPDNPDCPPLPPDDPAAHQLMHCVAGLKGYKCWHNNGETPFVANPHWMSHLPRNDAGEVPVDLQTAVELGLVHSRDYQRSLENLYLSALDVTFERFRFDAQFGLTNATFLTAQGRNRTGTGRSSTVVTNDAGLTTNQLFAGGGELMVGLANSLVWQFSGNDTDNVNTVLDFTLMQPLLRGAGRARVLERLTLSERTLLNNVRQMERYRRGFYVDIVTGRDAGQGPSRSGGVFGGAGLEGFTGVGAGGFGNFGGGGGGAGGFAGNAGAGQAGGFLGLLQRQTQIENLEANVASLRDSLAQLEAAYQANRIDRFQVDLAQQALYNAESQLLSSRVGFQSQLDTFKIDLGLPPQLEMTLTDRLLSRFELIDRAVPPLQNRLAELQTVSGDILVEISEAALADDFQINAQVAAQLEELDGTLASALEVHRQALAHFEAVELDLLELRDNLPRRQEFLRQLAAANDKTASTGIAADQARLAGLPRRLEGELAGLRQAFEARPQAVEALRQEFASLAADGQAQADGAEARMLRTFGEVSDVLNTLSGEVLELSLIQARARAESIILEPINLESERAIEIARRYRRDWMNARAALVNTWRLIEFNANDLLAGLDVVISGDVQNRGDNPLRFDNTAGQLRVGLQFDAPIQRVAERNNYRQALIEYQRAKRDYLEFEDRVAQSLRDTIRGIDLNQLNFELRRAAIRVAVDQVELARLRLSEPPRPGEAVEFASTTARDLVSALSDLLSAQNDFVSVWVDYQVRRLWLDFDLGTMQLDARGMWIDPGSDLGTADRITYDHFPLPPAKAASPTEKDDEGLAEDIPLPEVDGAADPREELPAPLPEDGALRSVPALRR